MATKKALVVSTLAQTIDNADTLLVGAGIDASSAGALAVGAATANSVVITPNVGIGGAPTTKLDVTTGQLAVPDGTAAAPAIAFRDDLNNGIFSPATDIFGIAVNGAEVARFQQSGGEPALLMGTSSPLGAVTVDTASTNTVLALVSHAPSGTPEEYKGGQYAGVRTRGTKAAPTAAGAGDGLLSLIGVGLTASGGYNYGALISFRAEEAYTSTASGGRIDFYTTAIGADGVTTLATASRMTIANNGNVGIGVTPTSTFSVGSSGTERFRVDGATGRIVEYSDGVPANGEVLIGNGTSFAKATLTAGTGIVITNGAGSITIAASNAGGVQPITTLSSSTTLDGTHYTVLCGPANETFTVTLPAAASSTGRIYNVKNIGTGTITIDGNGSETIDGATTYPISTQYQNVTIQCNGTAWFIL